MKNPTKSTQYRSISLSNVVSRTASKVLATKTFVSPHHSEHQSAFMCFISDNMLVAFETMHHISQNMNGKEGEVALKLNE